MPDAPDAYLISYPKCGRTWLRFMVGHAIREHFSIDIGNPLELEDLAEVDARVPRIRVTHDDKPQWKLPGEIETDKECYRGARVILLVRDPRDVLVSNYYQKSRRRGAFTGSLEAFAREPLGGYECILAFFNVWAQSREVPADLLLVRYEDLQARADEELARVLRFVGLADVPGTVVAAAVRAGAFERMHALERSDALDSPRLRPVDPADPSSFKTRRGRVGGYLDELSTMTARRLTRRLAESLSPWFGYAA